MHRSPAPAVVAACALLLASLVAAPAPGPEPAPPSVGDLHGRRIRWGECPEQPVPARMRCGTVDVPLDHAAPAKGTVAVALARIPATDRARRLGSLLLNLGGPGSPGIAGLAAGHAGILARLGERYDLIAFDPRGVGHSEPVSCGGSQQTGEGAAADTAGLLAALRAVAGRCALASGPVLPYMGTVNVSRDMDVVRRALGDEKLNFLGFSYGSRLGAVYAAQFPRSTGRMVLDGVGTLTRPLAARALVAARAQQQALDGFLAWCATQRDCVHGTDPRTAEEKVAALVARLDAQPLLRPDGSYGTGQDAVAAIAAAVDARSRWPALARALSRAERDGAPAALLQLGGPTDPTGPTAPRDEAGPDAAAAPVPADNGAAARVAVNCADDPDRSGDRATEAGVEQELADLEGEFRSASEIFGPLQLTAVLSCHGRPAGTDFIRRIHHPGAPRMLLVAARGDPAAPYAWTRETAERLGSAVLVDHGGDGHTGYPASHCVREHVDRFLIDGRLPTGTRSCPAEE
ncbi:alpha/beta hydrolase [Streptomyces sp. NBC_01233]|uniref:alpha/beta hydrolase n=1 Tax=Streptomyces sp. NBC_01233 TaxID=2903787 RepID=UPI002E0EF78A|nr:alpha/beta hydrolase [Streptomyces sp. NBC_01233]